MMREDCLVFLLQAWCCTGGASGRLGELRWVLSSNASVHACMMDLSAVASHACMRLCSPAARARDYFFGFSLQSELGAVVTGLGIMIIFRILRVPLLDGLPSG